MCTIYLFMKNMCKNELDTDVGKANPLRTSAILANPAKGHGIIAMLQ